MWKGCCVECLTAAIYSGARFDMGVGVSRYVWVGGYLYLEFNLVAPSGKYAKSCTLNSGVWGTWVHGAR